jgi:RimJ/RimL family protein N-acetyltransferase
VASADLPDLVGPRVRLRRPLDSDIDALVRLPINPDSVRMYGALHNGPLVRTREGAEDIVRWMRSEPMLWVIDASGYVGHVRLHTWNASDKRAALAIGLDDSNRLSQGLGTEAIKLVLGHAFNAIGLHRVSLRVVAYNVRAIRVYEKCGFVREGVERESACVGDVWYDDISMGLLASEFRPGADLA